MGLKRFGSGFDQMRNKFSYFRLECSSYLASFHKKRFQKPIHVLLMNERLHGFLTIGVGLMRATVYAVLALLLWFYNAKLKFLSPQINSVVVALLLTYFVFRVVRIIQKYRAGE